MKLICMYAQSKNGVIGDKWWMPRPKNVEDLTKLKNTVKGHKCVMGKSTFDTMKNYYKDSDKKWYPHASETIVLSSSMKEEPWIEVFHNVYEFLQKKSFMYCDDLRLLNLY